MLLLMLSLVALEALCAILFPTLDTLKAKTLQDSNHFDFRHWPTAEEMDALHRDDDWQNTEADFFPVKKIKQYYA